MCQVCFFYVDFLSRPFTNHRTAGEGGRHFIQPSLLLTPASQALRHQLGDYCRELTFALSQQPDSNQESLVSERTSLTTKLRACHVFQKKRTIFFSYIIQVGLCYPQLTLWQLIQPDLESLLVVRSAVRSWYLDRLLFLCWIVDGHTIHPNIKGLLPPTGVESSPFRISASKVAGLQVHATTPTI